jgi:hypothetical protein
METKKLTKRDYFNQLKEIVGDNAELVAFIDHEIELLDKKKSSNTKTKTQVENDNLKEIIKGILVEQGKPLSIVEIQTFDETLSTLSNQKMSALLKQLVDNQEIGKKVEKKKAYFYAM